MDHPYAISPEARNQLANLYIAYREGHLTLGAYLEFVDWFETHVCRVLGEQGFDAFGSATTRLYGMLTDPATRVLAEVGLPRTVRVIVTRDPRTEEVLVADIQFIPPF